MSTFTNFNGAGKNIARKMAINHCQGTSKVALFLPGAKQKCLKLALKQGAINRKTILICFEEDKEVADIIEKFLKENFDKSYLFRQRVENVNLPSFLRQEKLPKIDYAFLDYCGNLTYEVAWWIANHFCQSCENGAKIAFTFTTNPRGMKEHLVRKMNHLMEGNLWSMSQISIEQWGVIKRLEQELNDNTPNVEGDLYLAVCNIFSLDIKDWDHNGPYDNKRSYKLMWNLDDLVQGLKLSLWKHADLEDNFHLYKDGKPWMILLTATMWEPGEINQTQKLFLRNCICKNKPSIQEIEMLKDIIDRFRTAQNSRELAGAKRMATCYAQKRAKETGTHESYFRDAIRAHLTRNGVKNDY